MLWYLDASGKLAISRVKAGLTDGQLTEVEGTGLKEGMQVIVGVNTPAPANNANASARSARRPAAPSRAAASDGRAGSRSWTPAPRSFASKA